MIWFNLKEINLGKREQIYFSELSNEEKAELIKKSQAMEE